MAQEQGSIFQEWVRAPIKWVRALMMMGAHSLGWGHALINEGAPFWKRGSSKSVPMNFNLLIQHTVSRWCSSGCVHEGCGSVHHWLLTDHWSSWVCFYSRPIRQASTECPLPPLQQLNFWMQIPSQLSHFPNSNNDHCDLGFIVTACDVVRRPSRGHEVAMEDLRSKGVEGYVVPP